MLLNDINYSGYVLSKECSLLVNLKGHGKLWAVVGRIRKIAKRDY